MDEDTLDFIRDGIIEIEDNIIELSDFAHTIDQVDGETINKVMRIFHSIKGNAMALNLSDFSELAHHYEDFFILQKEKNDFNQNLLKDIIVSSSGHLSEIIENLKDNPLKKIDYSNYKVEFLNLTKEADTPKIEESEDTLRLLVIEDEEDLRAYYDEIICDKLTDAKIDHCENGSEALEKCQEKCYNAILTDYNMPYVNGEEFIKKIRNGNCQNKETPIIMITAYAPKLDLSEDILKNVFFIEKPIEEKNFYYYLKISLKARKSA